MTEEEELIKRLKVCEKERVELARGYALELGILKIRGEFIYPRPSDNYQLWIDNLLEEKE